MMMPGFLELMILALLGLFVLGMIVGVGALLANPRTRAVAAALLLLVPVGLVLLAVLGVGVARVSHQPAEVSQTAEVRELTADGYEELAARHLEEARAIRQAHDGPVTEAVDAEIDGPAEVVQEVVAVGPDKEEASEEPANEEVADVTVEPDGHNGEETEEESDAEEPVEEDNLSVEIHTGPDWVNRQPHKENGQYCWPVTTGPRQTREECDDALPKELSRAVFDYIDQKLMPGQAAARRVDLSQDYIREHMVGEDVWVEPASTSFGPMVQLHALVKFDHEVNERIGQKWQEIKTQQSLVTLVVRSGLLLFLMAIVYGYLKIDLKTDGAYRWRLRFGATASMLCAVCLFFMVCLRWSVMPW